MYLMIPSFKPVYNKSSYSNANKYIRDNSLTIDEMKDELYAVGYSNIEFMSKDNIKNYFIEDILLSGNTEQSEFGREFNDLYNNTINKLEYAKATKNQTMSDYSEEVLQNKLIEAYKSILTNEKVLPAVMNPIDVPYVADDIKNMFPNIKRADMMDFDAVSDLDLKFEFQQGKAGLGQNVNSLVDAVRGSMSDMYFEDILLKQGLYDEQSNTLLLDKEYSKELTNKELKAYVEFYNNNGGNITIEELKGLKKIPLFDSMMAYVNGFVDIAKDPYVVRGNWVTQTNNVGFLMLRTGVHPFFVNAFLGQPILKDYIKFVSNKESKIIDDSNNLEDKFKTSKLVELVSNGTLTTNNVTFDKSRLIRTVTNLNKKSTFKKLVNSSGDERISNKTLWLAEIYRVVGKKFNLNPQQAREDINIKSFVEEVDFVFNSIFEFKPTKQFSELDLADLKNQIVNSDIETQLIIFDKFKELIEVSKLLNQSVNASKVDVNGKGKNISSLLITKNLYDNLLTTNSPLKGFGNKLYRNGQSTFGQTYKENSIDNIYNIMINNPKFFLTASDSVFSTFNIISNYLYGTNLQNQELADKLERNYYSYIVAGFKPLQISNEDKSDLLNNFPNRFKEYKENFDNALTNKLFLKEGQGNRRYIALSNNKMSASEKNDLTDAWSDLLESNPKFGEDLIKYSFITSGFNNTFTQFHQLIPYEWFNKNRFNSYIKSLDLNNQPFDTAFIDQFFRNNTEDNSITRKVFRNEIIPVNNKFDTVFKLNYSKGYLLKYEFFDEGSMSNITRFYKLEGFDRDGLAVYTRTSALGSKDKQGNKVIEYITNDSNAKSILKSNQINVNQELIDNVKNEVLENELINDDLIVDNTQVIGIDNTNEINDVDIWENNKDKILSIYPDITKEQFDSLSIDEQNKLIECI